MKKYILSVALLIGVATCSFAQQQRQQGTPEERATRSTEMMEKALSLSAEQKTKIYTASLERVKAMTALREAAGEGNRPDMEKMKALNDKFEKAVNETLTDDQKVKYAEMLKAQRERGGNGQGRPQGNN